MYLFTSFIKKYNIIVNLATILSFFHPDHLAITIYVSDQLSRGIVFMSSILYNSFFQILQLATIQGFMFLCVLNPNENNFTLLFLLSSFNFSVL